MDLLVHHVQNTRNGSRNHLAHCLSQDVLNSFLELGLHLLSCFCITLLVTFQELSIPGQLYESTDKGFSPDCFSQEGVGDLRNSSLGEALGNKLVCSALVVVIRPYVPVLVLADVHPESERRVVSVDSGTPWFLR